MDVPTQRWLPGGEEPPASNSASLFKLVRLGLAGPAVFQCGAARSVTLVVRADMADFPGPQFIGYSYQHRIGAARAISTNPRMVILADSTPLFDTHGFRKDRLRAQASDNHGGRGTTVLFRNMSVGWVETPEAGVEGDNIFLARDTYEYEGDEAPADPADTFLLPAYVERK